MIPAHRRTIVRSTSSFGQPHSWTFPIQPSLAGSLAMRFDFERAEVNRRPVLAVESLREIASAAHTLTKEDRLAALFEWPRFSFPKVSVQEIQIVRF